MESWRQTEFVDASSGVVHASLEAFQDQKQSENKAVTSVLVSYRPLALAAEQAPALAVRTRTAQKKGVTVMLSSHRVGYSHALQ